MTLRAQKKIVRRREKNYKKYGQHHQWQALKEEMAKYKRMIWNLQKEKISNKFLEVRGNTKPSQQGNKYPTIKPSPRRDTE